MKCVWPRLKANLPYEELVRTRAAPLRFMFVFRLLVYEHLLFHYVLNAALAVNALMNSLKISRLKNLNIHTNFCWPLGNKNS